MILKRKTNRIATLNKRHAVPARGDTGAPHVPSESMTGHWVGFSARGACICSDSNHMAINGDVQANVALL
ncbi:MAG: hypothetical protein V3T70_08975, partial [Phycisphaerae bacterium]